MFQDNFTPSEKSSRAFPGDRELWRMAQCARQHAQGLVPGKIREVKIAAGTAWEIRFLPTLKPPPGGSENPWFVRRGQHWVQGAKPVICPVRTSELFGGDLEHCRVCDAIEELSQTDSTAVQALVDAAKVRVQALVWCRVGQWTDEKGCSIVEDEVSLTPWRIWLSRIPASMLLDAVAASVTEDLPLGVLDPKHGCNFKASRNGPADPVKLKLSEPSPIFPLDDQFDRRVTELLSRIQPARFRASTDGELENFVRRLDQMVRHILAAGPKARALKN